MPEFRLPTDHIGDVITYLKSLEYGINLRYTAAANHQDAVTNEPE